MSAYALFFRDTQAAIKGQNPNASFGEVSKIVASMWDVLATEHKNVSTALVIAIWGNFSVFNKSKCAFEFEFLELCYVITDKFNIAYKANGPSFSKSSLDM